MCTFFFSCNQATNPENGTGPGGTGNNAPFLGTWEASYSKVTEDGSPINGRDTITFNGNSTFTHQRTVVEENYTAIKSGTYKFDSDSIFCTVLTHTNWDTKSFTFKYELKGTVLSLDDTLVKANYTK